MTLAFFSTLATTVIFIYLCRRTRIAQVLLDFPNARGLHASPVARVGGVALFASVWLFSGLWIQRDLVAAIAGLSVVLVAISFIDDLRPLPALLRLLVHAGMAITIVLIWNEAFGLASNLYGTSASWLLSPVGAFGAVVAIVWMTNLYNFMDGADGLAGGMSVIGFGAYAIASASIPNSGGSMSLLAVSIAGASAGFLAFNFSPAKVFMGDAGSIPLGFLAAALGIHGSLEQLWPWWFGVLVFSPFIVDASTTLLRRTAQGNKPWIAHRDHYYQRLILSGWSHRKTALVYYCVMLASGGSALVAIADPGWSVILITWVITYALLLLFAEWHLHQKKNNKIKE